MEEPAVELALTPSPFRSKVRIGAERVHASMLSLPLNPDPLCKYNEQFKLIKPSMDLGSSSELQASSNKLDSD